MAIHDKENLLQEFGKVQMWRSILSQLASLMIQWKEEMDSFKKRLSVWGQILLWDFQVPPRIRDVLRLCVWK